MTGRSGRGLAAGHRIDQVIHADDFQIDVAAGGMDQMIAADSREVAVAGINHDVQLRVGELQSGGEWDGAPMRGVERVELHISGDAPCATNSRNQGQGLQVNL